MKIKVPESTKFLNALAIAILLLSSTLLSTSQIVSRVEVVISTDDNVQLGAEQFEKYLSLLKGRKVALVANHTSMVGKSHLVDTLKGKGVQIMKVFAPEHGFRGAADAGEKVASTIDKKTGIPIVSLYGDNKKPSASQMQGVDVVVYDIQDVGARFYTYISTMSYVMEACAEAKIPFIVLDRPNPNGHFIDGPVLEPAFSSFVGMHQVPIAHGMTVGEYAQMVNGEGWLKNKLKCNLTVVPCIGWKHSQYYQISIPPSPNLTNMNAIYLYPTLCLFEGTVVSVGRGTDKPFQLIGYPGFKDGKFEFTPKSGAGSKQPMYENKICKGFDLSGFGENFVRDSKTLYLFWLINMYQTAENKTTFFNSFFDKLAGTDQLKKQIIAGKTEEEIKASWKPGLTKFKEIRKKYLLYADV
jgi:uncharacterized protein YbbC (DUF1343 family)